MHDPVTRKQLEKYIRLWQHNLGLNNWDIAIKYEDPSNEEEKILMQVNRNPKYDDAVLIIHSCVIGEEEWGDWVESDLDRIPLIKRKIRHELLHLCARDLVMIPMDLETTIGEHLWFQFNARLDLAEEQMVDRLARALAVFDE